MDDYIEAGRRGVPWNGLHWTTQLKQDIMKTNFKGTWKEAVSKKKELNDMANKKEEPKKKKELTDEEKKEKKRAKWLKRADEAARRRTQKNNNEVIQRWIKESEERIEKHKKKLEEEEKRVFKYNTSFFDKLDGVYTKKTKYWAFPNTPEKKEDNKIIDTLIQAQGLPQKTKGGPIAWDLYITPESCIKMILSNILKNEVYNFLEPSSGTFKIIREVLLDKDLKINSITAIEDNPKLFELMDGKIIGKNFSYLNKDFLKYKPAKNDFNLIIMNPPYSGYFNGKKTQVLYKIHILKAIELLYKSSYQYEKLLYVICPKLHDENHVKFGDIIDIHNIEKILFQPLLKKNNDDINILQNNEIIKQVRLLGDCDNFKKINKNNSISNLKMKFYVYEFII